MGSRFDTHRKNGSHRSHVDDYRVHSAGAVNDAGQIEVGPRLLDFGITAVGTCLPKKVEVRNRTGAAIEDPVFRIVGTEAFFFTGVLCRPTPLLPGLV